MNKAERRAGPSKLTNAQVLRIKDRLNAGEPYRSIARDYPVEVPAVRDIHRERTWSDIGTITNPFVPQWTCLTDREQAYVVAEVRAGRTLRSVGDELSLDTTSVGDVFFKATGMRVRTFREMQRWQSR